ncbi:MAG: pirin family protein [Myxococcota bacterium]
MLPSPRRRMVGPFIFFDHMGPGTLEPGKGIDVRPHPHINLATVTYLFEGELDHRDSLGIHQTIHPGALNLMVAGRGIVHSERSGPAFRERGGTMHGIQLWLALPRAHEEVEPAFEHHPTDTLPTLERDGVTLRVLLGEAFGERSPATSYSALFYAEAHLAAGSTLALPSEHHDRAFYVVSGTVRCGAETVSARRMVVLVPGQACALQAQSDAQVMLLGGAPLEGRRHMFWNFVSSRPERIEQAKRDWDEGKFPLVPGDSEERIPLPK